MRVEIVVRWRCGCGAAHETPMILPQVPTQAVEIGVTIKRPPKGWVVENGAVHCPEHPPRMVEPVTALPQALARRG